MFPRILYSDGLHVTRKVIQPDDVFHNLTSGLNFGIEVIEKWGHTQFIFLK